ncbi:MAG: 2-oxoacid:acceptor oxidoreductase subunit alpha [Betaproteobacteria bacterium]
MPERKINDFVIKFANVNGSGSASANKLFARSILRMGVPVSARNIFPSNIQGLPTWYEVRVSEKGHLGSRGGVDIMVAMNAQSWNQDQLDIESGGYLIYDSSRPVPASKFRTDITVIGIPITDICNREFKDPRQRQLFRNMVYLGALSSLLAIDIAEVERLIQEQFSSKEALVSPNVQALHFGMDYATEHFDCPIGFRVKRSSAVGSKIFIDGNSAAALGCVYGGATVAAWYPITPSSSLAESYEKFCKTYRHDHDTGRNSFASIQAEDELASIGMVIGASWNGARAFTCTSGPGISLMQEFIGLAYFAEIPAVIFDVQRGGPSTGMPTRTQQSDILSCAYASHGDTKQILLIPSDPKECFDFGYLAFDYAEKFQTPVFVMSDLDIGMNDHLTDPLEWNDEITYDRGKVLSKENLDELAQFGRYLDVDGDGVPYRTLPGTHPSKGAFFTRGTSRDRYAKYSESGVDYQDNMQRLQRKFEQLRTQLPSAIVEQGKTKASIGVIYYGSTEPAMKEALQYLEEDGVSLDSMRIRAFPFGDEVSEFIDSYDRVFLVEQNRDAQMKSLLVSECNIDPNRITSILHYNGSPITARFIRSEITQSLDALKPSRKRKSISQKS